MDSKKKQIVFFCGTAPYVMIYKMAKEFKKRGYETVLITIIQEDKWNRKLYEDAFDKIICSNFQVFKPTPKNLINMLKRTPFLIKSLYDMKRLNPYVVIDIARPNYSALLIMKYFKKYPLIYFPSDISSHFFSTTEEAIKKGHKMYEIKSERYCFENAEAVLHKGAIDELEHLKKETMLGEPINVTSNTIQFCPYCSDEFIVPISSNKLSKKDGSLHMVYVGGFGGGEKHMNFYTAFFKKFTDQKIHVHLYVKTHHLSEKDDKKNIKPIIKFSEGNEYLHLEFALPPKELISEISKYDFGLWMDPFFLEGRGHRFTSGNKLATYLEAGMPCLYTSTFKFVDSLGKKYNLSFPIDTENLDSLNGIGDRLKKINYKQLEKNILKAREDFNMSKHIPRLEKFIDKVVNEKLNQN